METIRKRDWLTWLGLLLVGAGAAVLSFSALRDLARSCGIAMPALFPIIIDVYAATATRIWLRRAAHPDAVRFACWAAWCAIFTTIAGNAVHGWLTESHRAAPWWLVVIVSALPAVALGSLVHLAVLVGRQVEPEPAPVDLRNLFEPEPVAQSREAVNRHVGPLGRRPVPLPAPDDVLVADLRDWAVDHGELPPVDAIRLGYGVGTQRAGRLRGMALEPAASAGAVDQ